MAARCVTRDADIFWLRLERYFEDLYHPLIELYGQRDDAMEQFGLLFDQMIEAYATRPEPLRLLDLERQFTRRWFQEPNMVGYVFYVDLFAGNLNGIREKIGYLQELGITYLHLMPILEPSPGNNDGGYAVKDYRKVNPELGTMSDLKQLSTELHACGISLCLDLVLNHTAKDHEWAQKAIAGEQQYLDYYYTFGDSPQGDASRIALYRISTSQIYQKSFLTMHLGILAGIRIWEIVDAGCGQLLMNSNGISTTQIPRYFEK